jgi:capsule polysaccharide export protein KpsE/RkpR
MKSLSDIQSQPPLAGGGSASPTQAKTELKWATLESFSVAWLLWRKRQFVLRLTGIGAVVGLILALLIPSRFTATAQLMPPDAMGGESMGMAAMAAGMADKAGGLGTAAADLLGFKSSGALFVGILKSRTVQDRLVEQFDLRKVYGTRYGESARLKLGDRTEISEDRKSGVIKIDVTDRDRDRAQQMAKAYVDELNRVVSGSAMSAAARERAFIEGRMAEVKKEVDASAAALAEFSSEHNTIDLKEQARAMVDAVATVQGQKIAAESELKALQSIYTEDNFRVRAARAQISELTRQMQVMDGSTRGARGTSGAVYPTIRQLPGLGVTYEDLYRRNRTADAVYEALVQQYEMAKIEEAKDTPKVQMLDVPERPEIKSYPPRVAILVGCALLSFCFATGWAIGDERWCAIDENNAGKRLLREIANAFGNYWIWRSRGVLRIRTASTKVARKFKRLRQSRSENEVAAD